MKKKEKEIMIRVDDKLYELIKKKAKEYKTTISNMARIIIFLGSPYMKIEKPIINFKQKDDNENINKTMKKKILILLTKKEYEIIDKLAKITNLKISTIIRTYLKLINQYAIQKQVDLKIKMLIELDKMNFDFSNLEFINKLFKVYKTINLPIQKTTNLSVQEIFEKLILNIPEEKISEIIKTK